MYKFKNIGKVMFQVEGRGGGGGELMKTTSVKWMKSVKIWPI